MHEIICPHCGKAFKIDEAGYADILKQVRDSEFEKQLQSDVEALILVRIPQVPSSRALGSNPVFSFDEFMARTPADRSKWKIVPTGPRPFPDELRDKTVAMVEGPGPVPLPIAGIAAGGVFGIGALIRRRRKKKAAQGSTSF